MSDVHTIEPGRAPYPDVDFSAFHDGPVQRLVGEHGHLLAGRSVPAGPLAVYVGDQGFTYRRGPGGGLTVEPGTAADAETVVRVEPGAWSEWLHELHSNMGLVYGDLVTVERGGLDGFAGWEPALRAAWSGRPVRVAVPALSGSGGPSRFTLDTDALDLAAFLSENGFLHIEGVFDPVEIDRLREEVERLTARARPDDGRSWWAVTGDGADVCCRLIYNEQRSEAVASLIGDERLERIAGLAEEPVRLAADRLDGLSVVMKPPGVVQGLADLPFHRDCGMGGHPIMCPAINVGIQLDAATPETGCLRFVPGSHRSSQLPPRPDTTDAVTVETRPGDVTVHYGHVLHQSAPPTGPGGRRVLYCFFPNERAHDRIPAGQGYNDVLFDQAGDGRVTNIAEDQGPR